MNPDEAQRMARWLSGLVKNAAVEWYYNKIDQPVVRITWPQGPIYLTSVRECMRFASQWRTFNETR